MTGENERQHPVLMHGPGNYSVTLRNGMEELFRFRGWWDKPNQDDCFDHTEPKFNAFSEVHYPSEIRDGIIGYRYKGDDSLLIAMCDITKGLNVDGDLIDLAEDTQHLRYNGKYLMDPTWARHEITDMHAKMTIDLGKVVAQYVMDHHEHSMRVVI